MKKQKIQHKESILHKLILTLISAAATAVIAGFVGYKLNSHLPELYYEISPALTPAYITGIGRVYRLDTAILNLGKGPATDLVIRYSFNRNIVIYDYNYSEEFNGKLPTENVKGGTGTKELILKPARLVAKDKLQAAFFFSSPSVKTEIRVIAKEGLASPYSEWQEKITQGAKFGQQMTVTGKHLAYRLKQKYLDKK